MLSDQLTVCYSIIYILAGKENQKLKLINWSAELIENLTLKKPEKPANLLYVCMHSKEVNINM